ncbi:unnamed protein product [Prunus armeniaca]
MAMKNNGFKQCNSDYTLFFKHRKGKEISQLQDYLAIDFEMKDLGGLKYFLGLNHHLGEYPNQVPTNKERYHMNAVLQILRYLKSGLEKGFLFSKYGHMNIDGYSDVDWAGNVTDRKSTLGYFTFVGDYYRKMGDAKSPVLGSPYEKEVWIMQGCCSSRRDILPKQVQLLKTSPSLGVIDGSTSH